MNTTKLKLTNPTDDELSAAVAEHVAGWTDIREEEGEDVDIEAREIYPWKGLRGTFNGKRDHIRHYATSADWVLPLLEKHDVETCFPCYFNKGRRPNRAIKLWRVTLSNDTGREWDGYATTFSAAICIALLRANGIEVEHPAQPARASS